MNDSTKVPSGVELGACCYIAGCVFTEWRNGLMPFVTAAIGWLGASLVAILAIYAMRALRARLLVWLRQPEEVYAWDTGCPMGTCDRCDQRARDEQQARCHSRVATRATP